VSFVGDLIAVAVASTGEAAVDAAAAVLVDYEPMPVIVDPEKSDSVAFEFDLGDEGALNGADVIVRGRFVNQRLAAAPIEGNAIVAEPDANGSIRVWVSTQVPFGVRDVVAAALGLPEETVRVIAGDVGGAFTNTAVMSADPGAGRPEAIAIIGRVMDMLAAELNVDPADLRRRNLIAGPFPHATPTGRNYDSGDYSRALDLALQAAGYDDLRNDQRARRERDERLQLGIGISSYVEMTAVLYTGESATATAQADGSMVIST